MKLEQRNIIR